MKKKLLTLILAVVLSLGTISTLAACGGAKTPANSVTVGSITELSGVFRYPSYGKSSPGAADLDINKLTSGYATIVADKNGNYQWDTKVTVKSHDAVVNGDGSKTFTVVLKENLKFSDGSPIKAANYLVRLLAFASPIAQQANSTLRAGDSFVGFSAYNTQTDGSVPFSGVRLLSDYSFSLTVRADDIPYYYDIVSVAVEPDPIALWAGAAEVKDDGNGAYLTESFWAKNGEDYVMAAHLNASSRDINSYPFSGPYVLQRYNSSNKSAILKRNPEYLGNFEGTKPRIEEIRYVRIVSETQTDAFKKGEIDILAGVTGGEDTAAALALETANPNKFGHVSYDRAGYGKLGFRGDFSPVMFTEVRQAIMYSIDRTKFMQDFTGGYGSIVHGPYYEGAWMYDKDTLNLTEYSLDLDKAQDVLVAGGWTYNAQGGAYTEGVRYKKLSAEEATEANIGYKSVDNQYSTVKVGDDYYMPLVINWLGTTPNSVTDLLKTQWLNNSEIMNKLGMYIVETDGDFTKLQHELSQSGSLYGGTPTYCAFNYATGFNSAVYDYAYNWSIKDMYWAYSMFYIKDEADYTYDNDGEKIKVVVGQNKDGQDVYDYQSVYDVIGDKLHIEDVVEDPATGLCKVTVDGTEYELGMDALSFAMVYNTAPKADSKFKNEDEVYKEWWRLYIQRWNHLATEVPLYSNQYFDFYNKKLHGLETTPFWSPIDALIDCYVEGFENGSSEA